MFRRLLRAAHRLSALLLTLLLALLNLRLAWPAAYPPAESLAGSDVPPQLRHLRGALDAGAGQQMQRLFPEGFFFSHALYGLAWVELGLREAEGSPGRAEALREARWALARLDTPDGTRIFSPSLDPPLGVFFNGWASWLRGGALLLEPAAARNQTEEDRLQADCAALAAAFDRSPTPFLSAYPGQAWAVDSTVAVAALRLCDALFGPRHERTIAAWLAAARERLDPATGLMPHRVDPVTGQGLEGARGSSQSIIARFLVEIDPAWGAEQYALFRRQFGGRPLGVPGIREYPLGSDGAGDVDSGPLIFGVSASATVVAAGAAQLHGDESFARAVFQTSEALGMPWRWDGRKRYAFGLLPVGDAFLAWAKTARPWIAPLPAAAPAAIPPIEWWWRLPFALLSLLAALLAWLPALISRRRRRRS